MASLLLKLTPYCCTKISDVSLLFWGSGGLGNFRKKKSTVKNSWTKNCSRRATERKNGASASSFCYQGPVIDFNKVLIQAIAYQKKHIHALNTSCIVRNLGVWFSRKGKPLPLVLEGQLNAPFSIWGKIKNTHQLTIKQHVYNVFTHMPYSGNKRVCLKRVYHPKDNSECGRRFIADHYNLLGGGGERGLWEFLIITVLMQG